MLVGYSAVHVGKSLLWAGEDALTLYILVRFLAVPPALAGAIFLASALWNAACDGLIGMALHRSAWMRRRMPIIVVPAILASVLGFAALPFAAERSAWTAAILLLVFRTGFSLADVPHNGLTRLLVADGRHLRAARIRATGSAAAALVIGVACVAILSPGPQARTVAALLAAGIGAVALLLMGPLPFLLAAERGALPLEASPASAAVAKPGRAMLAYCIATAIGIAGLGAIGKALMHLNFLATAIGPAALLLVTAGRLAAVWLWSPLTARVGHRIALGLAYAACAAAALCLPWFSSLPDPAAFAVLLLFGIAVGGVAFLSWAVLTRVIAAGAGKGSAPGFTAGFGLFTMTMKIALGVSAMLVGGWLPAVAVAVDPARFWPLAILVFAACGSAGGMIVFPVLRARGIVTVEGIAASSAGPVAEETLLPAR